MPLPNAHSPRVLAVLLALTGCGHEVASAAETHDDPPPAVDALSVQVGPIVTTIDATANLVAERQVTVVAEVDGRLLGLGVDEGTTVAAGDLIGVLDGKAAKLAITAAKIKATGASATHVRADNLAQQKLLAPEELEKLLTARDSAAHELSQAQHQLARTRVRAPIDGRITKRHVVAGKWMRTGDAIVDITDFSTLVARIHVPERDALALTVGRAAELRLQADEHVAFAGRIRRISDVVDTKSGTVEVTVEVDDPPETVRSGSFVSLRIERTRDMAARWLPREAIVREPGGAYVLVLADGTVTRRPVELGAEQGSRIAIVAGAQAGELVVLAGQGGLRDGDAVSIRPVTH